jgi:hypothetical protein
MFELILMAALSPMATQIQPLYLFPETPVMTAQVRPCVWPNTCKVEAPAVAQFRPCVWPNKCKAGETAEPVLASVKPCVFPNRCGNGLTEDSLQYN